MRTSIIVLAFAALGFMAADATAATLTEQQGRNVCGKKLQEGGGQMGCSKACGDKICDYNCDKKSGKCAGTVIGMTRPPSKTKTPTAGVGRAPAIRAIRQ